MKVHIYTGLLKLIEKSGVGQAIHHQKTMLECSGVTVLDNWQEKADAIHINTVFPDSAIAALRAKLRGELVVYYGHSTEEDFMNSFKFSNLIAPLFRRWICFCYSLGDIIITPTPYSRKLLLSYGLKPPIYAISNGIDCSLFSYSKNRRAAFRRKYGLSDSQKVVISVGHLIARKGILDYIALSKTMPDVEFFWFGYTNPSLMEKKVLDAVLSSPANLHFPGFVSQEELMDGYSGADVFCFCSQEETEGIAVLEALSSSIPVVVRDIPVYEDWLIDSVNVYKAKSVDDFESRIKGIIHGSLPSLAEKGRKTAEERDIRRTGHQLCGLYQIQKYVSLYSN